MENTVVIDAGHGGYDNGARYKGRREKDDTLRLALAVENILTKNCVNVVLTRSEDVYNTPYEKAMISNNVGADLFVSIHRNAYEPNVSKGVETLVYDNVGIKNELGKKINSNLQKLGFENRGITERPNLVVLKRTKSPAVLLEVGFIDNDEDNTLFDEKFNEIAEAIAYGIIDVLGIKCEPENMPPKNNENHYKKLYRVQVGSYKNRSYAEDLLEQLKSEGYPAFIVLDNNLYKVQSGAFAILDNAVRMEEKLKKAGYNTFITT